MLNLFDYFVVAREILPSCGNMSIVFIVFAKL